MTASMRLSFLGMLVSLPLLAAPPDATQPKVLLAQAEAAKAANRFDKALDLYLKTWLAGERSAEVREQIHDCLRQTAQNRRHRDPAFRQYILALQPAEALSLYAEIVEKLSTHHAEKEKAKPEKLFALSLQEIERALNEAAFRKQNLPGVSDAKLAKFVRSLKEEWLQRLPKTPRECRAALQELVRAAQNDLQLAEPTAIVLEAICGACAGLDESTVYLAPPQVKEKPNTEPTISRAEIIDSMTGVGIIAISRFHESTPMEFEAAFNRLKDAGLRSLILDLRGNGGGSFTAAIRLAERFVPGGVIATTTGQVPEFEGRVFSSSTGMNAIDTPLILLVDGKTMSSAEIFASAIKDQGRATLIGMPTFGKGSVQSPLTLSAADDAKAHSGLLIVTIAKVLNRNGEPLHGVGVIPDVIEPEPELQLRLGVRAAELARGM